MDRARRHDAGAVLIGLIILGVGVYYTLVNVFGLALAELNWDMIWPLAIIGLGLAILWRAWMRMTPDGQDHTEH
jgi:hypothetical protein